jgi:hypothetical protein
MSSQYRQHCDNISMYADYTQEEWADFAPLSLDWQREEEQLIGDDD